MSDYKDSNDYIRKEGYSSLLEKVYGSRLTPTDEGCWKIIFVDNYYSDGIEVKFTEDEIVEICNWSRFKLLPVKNNRWKISIENTKDIIRGKKGKFDIKIHDDLFLVMIRKDGCWSFYCPSNEEYNDEPDNDEEISHNNIADNDGEYFDDDNDEDNVMRGFR